MTPPRAGTVGLGQAVSLYLGAILGAGVLVLPGVTVADAGPAALVSWMLVGALGVPLAVTFATLARTYPDAGGVAVFARRAFGADLGRVAGWWFFVAGSVGQAIVPLTGAYYAAAGLRLGRGETFAIAAVLLGLATASNLLGLRIGARLQLAIALTIGLVLVTVIVAATGHVDVGRLRPFAPHGTTAVVLACVPLFYAFAGWEVITHLAPDFRDPGRDLMRATAVTVGIVVVLYVALCFVVVTAGSAGGLDRTAVTTVAVTEFGHVARPVLACVAALIALGTSNAYIAGTSRLGFALSRDGDLPPGIGVLRDDGVPARAIWATAAIAAIALAVCGIAGAGPEDLLFIPSSLVVATYVLAMASGVRLTRGRGRAVAVAGLVPCCVLVPFLRVQIVVPAGLALLALAWGRRRPSARRRRA